METLTLEQTVEILKISRRTLNRKMNKGSIDFYKHPGMTGKVFFTQEQVANYIKKHCTV